MSNNLKKSSNIFQFILTFVLLYIGMQFALRTFFPSQFNPEYQNSVVVLDVQDATVKDGHHPVLLLHNRTEKDLVLGDSCPMPPVKIFKILEDGTSKQLSASETIIPCKPLEFVSAGDTATIDLSPWKYSLFFGSSSNPEFGTYKAVLEAGTGSLIADSTGQIFENVQVQFSTHEAGTITKIFRTFITKPILNLLIFIASFSPGYNLGIAIIIITLIIKLLLFFPTQHAMEGQRKLQKVQPQLDAIRKKHKNNPEKMNKEIMELWKREGVNPLQSCLPILIQFPILIGLFYTIRDGSVLELSSHLIYDPFQNLDWVWGTNFIGLNLLEPNFYFFPPFLVIIQFLQMKLSFAIAAKKKGDTKKKESSTPDAQQMQQRMMLYGLPLLIGFFAFSFPAAVSLYWAVSTVFAIGQQIVVNRKI